MREEHRSVGELSSAVKMVRIPPSTTRRPGFLRRLIDSVKAPGNLLKAVQSILGEVDDCRAIVAYSGGEVLTAAARVAREKGVPLIVRGDVRGFVPEDLSRGMAVVALSDEADSLFRAEGVEPVAVIRPAVRRLPRARRHAVVDRAITFLSQSASVDTCNLMAAMAVARPASRITWYALDTHGPDHYDAVPPNLTVSRCGSVAEAVERGPVDWMVMLDSKKKSVPLAVAQSLSAGIPVVCADAPCMLEVVDDDCAVIFGPNPPREEFVRGMLPFVESDLRGNALSGAALEAWSRSFDPSVNAPALLDIINGREAIR